MKKFDLAIIGGGAGAFAAAIRANELGAKTALINDGLPLGGTCVNVGCVPSKTLLFAGEVLHLAKNHPIAGIELEIKNFDFNRVIKNELDLVEKLRTEKYEKVLKSLKNVAHIKGRSKFVAKNEVIVGNEKIKAEKFIIATGSTANVPPIEGIKETGFVTHIEALKLKKQPKEMIVVGAGPLGLEFAQMYERLGTKVTILQKGPSIFPKSEPELISRLSEILTKEGIAIKTNVEVTSAYKEGSKKVLVYKEADLSPEAPTRPAGGLAKGDEILLASGKTPNTKDLDLEKAGVEIDKKKAIKVNSSLKTTAPHIYAVGDVANLPLRQEPSAGREGTLAAENALTGSQKSIDYNTVPYTIFTDPQLAGVGFTEDQEIDKLGTCACRTISFQELAKAQIMGRTEGLIKMAIHPKTKQILGVHILTAQAGELISQAMVLVKNKNTVNDVIDSLPMFPTLSEAIKLVALSFTKDISKLSCCI